MPNYIHACPNCGADKNDISWAAAYFDVYKCNDCGEKYCHKCRDSNGALLSELPEHLAEHLRQSFKTLV